MRLNDESRLCGARRSRTLPGLHREQRKITSRVRGTPAKVIGHYLIGLLYVQIVHRILGTVNAGMMAGLPFPSTLFLPLFVLLAASVDFALPSSVRTKMGVGCGPELLTVTVRTILPAPGHALADLKLPGAQVPLRNNRRRAQPAGLPFSSVSRSREIRTPCAANVEYGGPPDIGDRQCLW